MSILQTVQQPAESAGTAVPVRATMPALPGPVRFVSRALAALWVNGKARIGLVILGGTVVLTYL